MPGDDDLRAKGAIVVAGLLLVVAVLVYRMGGDEGVLNAPPPRLLGAWVADEPRYAGRALIIYPDLIELRLGEEGGPAYHPIESITETRDSESWSYEIVYGSVEGEQSMELFLDDSGVLRLRNPPNVRWRRSGSLLEQR